MAKTIVGSFDSFEEAQEVLRDLQQRGFARDDISVIANNASGQYGSEGQLPRDAATSVSDTGAGTATGAAAGGVLGGAAGLVVGLMGLAIPGIGPIIAAGPIAAALAGAGVGAVAGGLIGGLTGVGVSEDDAQYYAESVRRGGALVTVRADDALADEAATAMRGHGAVDIERRVEQWKEQGWTRHDPAATPYSVDQVERERGSRRSNPSGSLGAMSDQNLGVASQMGAMTTASGMSITSTSSTWTNDDDADFRTHHRDTMGSSGEAYEDYEPAYRYGGELGSNTRYRGRGWSDIESDARRDWESSNPNGGWERFKSAVRRGWERTSNAVERAVPGDSDRDGR